MASISGLDHVVIAVSDWERSGRFYRDVLGGTELRLEEQRIAYRIGSVQLNLHGPGSEPAIVARHPGGPGSADLCFLWDGPIEAAIDHLNRKGVEVLEGPVDRLGAAGPGRSVYFSDPDGSLIELIAYSEPPSNVSAQPLMQ
jgi:catechol 2,3-dioxygenase-like lactoylglutathione lyase family enzyme